MAEDIRSYNVGASDYATHKYQSWDFWITWALNPFDADLSKRILRKKETDGRKLDYEKIYHICGERLRQLDLDADVWPNPKKVETTVFNEMIADYHLIEDDKNLMETLLMKNLPRTEAYRQMQSICKKRIKDFS